MTIRSRPHSRIAVIGTGSVGADFAYALTIKGTVREMALINRTVENAKGEAMDLNHAMPFCSPLDIEAGGYELCKDAHLVVITAGAAQEEGMTRLDLAEKNAGIMKKIVQKIMEYNQNPILLVVSNPVDVLTYVALKESGLPPGQVMGSGTVLDSSRFRYLLSQNCSVDPRNVHSHVVGEHGDSEVPLWSRVNIGGVPLEEYCPVCERDCPADFRDQIMKRVRDAAYKIIDLKGFTSYGIGMALVRIVEAVMRDEDSVLTVSSMVNDYYGVNDVCLSLPSVVDKDGVSRQIKADLSHNEAQALEHSAKVIRDTLESVGY